MGNRHGRPAAADRTRKHLHLNISRSKYTPLPTINVKETVSLKQSVRAIASYM